jgi:hypothetical protein
VEPVVPLKSGILNKNKSNELALLLSFDMNVFNNSLSNDEVFVILRVCVKPLIPGVQPVDITPLCIFEIKRDKSKSNKNLVNP